MHGGSSNPTGSNVGGSSNGTGGISGTIKLMFGMLGTDRPMFGIVGTVISIGGIDGTVISIGGMLMFGTKYMAMLYGFTFFSHQVGGFLGVWLGGILYEAYGSYDVVWWLSVASPRSSAGIS